MARKGKAQIEQELYEVIAPFFEGKISGTLYQSDTRPRDSKAEDAVLIAGTPSGGQIQEGNVRILIFVPDIDCGIGRPVPDLDRIQQLEPLDQPILDLLNDSLPEYAFEFYDGTTTSGTATTSEHSILISYKYKRITF